MSAILALVRFLPAAIEAGISVANVIRETHEKTAARSPVESFALQTLRALPQAIEAGLDVVEAARRLNDEVGAMLRENRAPTDAEWAEQIRRISVLEGRLDAAAAPGT